MTVQSLSLRRKKIRRPVIKDDRSGSVSCTEDYFGTKAKGVVLIIGRVIPVVSVVFLPLPADADAADAVAAAA